MTYHSNVQPGLFYYHLLETKPDFVLPETVIPVMAIFGEEARLPCLLKEFPSNVDRAKVVMWFRNGTETPFYT